MIDGALMIGFAVLVLSTVREYVLPQRSHIASLLFVGWLGSCGKEPSSGPASTTSGSAVKDAAQDAAHDAEQDGAIPFPTPTRGVLQSAMRSVPRRNWPCRLVEIGDANTLETRFEYGKRTSCVLPVDIVADGVIGCPDKVVLENLENHVAISESYEYDESGRLSTRTTLGKAFLYEWDGEVLLRRKIGDRWSRYSGDDQSITIPDVSGRPERIDLDESGRVLGREVSFGGNTNMKTKLIWKDTRLNQITWEMMGTTVTRVDYDCRKPARR